MRFQDKAIILSKTPFKERSYIIKVFTAQHGLYSGLISATKKSGNSELAEGNIIDFNWQARLEGHLGRARIELIKSYNAKIILDKTKLFAFNAIIDLVKIACYEHIAYPELYEALILFIAELATSFNIHNYIKLELAILAIAGYQLRLDSCAKTGQQHDLIYVSPKSGQAVSRLAGMPYVDKLLPLPKQLLDTNIDYDQTSLKEALQLTSYFFKRHLIHKNNQGVNWLNFHQYLVSNATS